MQSTPFLSIVVPVYNAQCYLRQCIDSLIEQKCDDIEIVLVDDGSTDSSPAICEQCKKDNPTIVTVIHQRNQGPLIARVRGFIEASGAYMIAMDADDMFLPGAIKEICRSLRLVEPDVLTWGFTSSYRSLQRGVAPQNPSSVKKEEILELLCKTWDCNAMWAKAIKRSCLCLDVDYSCYSGMTLCEDFLQTLFVYDRAERFFQIETPLYFYRQNPASTTHSVFTSSLFGDVVSAMQCAMEFAEKWNRQYSRQDYTSGIAAKSLYSIVNYARDLSICGEFNQLKELGSSSFFLRNCSVNSAMKRLRLDRRFEVYLIKHKMVKTLRFLSLLRLGLHSDG